jgi:ribosomal protein L4
VALSASEAHAALSFRNIAGVSVLAAEEVGVSELVAAASVLFSEPALELLSSRAASRSRG